VPPRGQLFRPRGGGGAPGAEVFPAAAGRAARAAVVVVAVDGDAGVAAADGTGGALQLAGGQAAGQDAERDEQESGSGHPGERRHGDLSMETDGVGVSVRRPRSRRRLREAKRARPGSGYPVKSRVCTSPRLVAVTETTSWGRRITTTSTPASTSALAGMASASVLDRLTYIADWARSV